MKLFRRLLGLEEPWIIKEIKFDHQEKRVDISIDFPSGSRFPYPVCGQHRTVHDTEERTWRHLNVFQYPTYVHAREPRIKCVQHGKKTVDLPWARKGSGLSLHFGALIVEMGRKVDALRPTHSRKMCKYFIPVLRGFNSLTQYPG
ncbi:MAG: transposase family protein [Candidatus Thermoplasmatota archaeon]|nr:transposase family protein [Candidatus Thermoplasmatota archaeon]